ncbi:MAG: dihydrodipicolinate synthase family protein [Bacteroidia bacterium]|nr:dihydrodipicolinate synthase family protein [Bacteroidia bacterium]
MISPEKYHLLMEGTVIPAHPLVLTEDRRLDEDRQRRLTRYYLAAGVGGLAVGVHTTQFAIRDPRHNLYEPVLRLAAEEVENARLTRPVLKIAGVSGDTEQALGEARLAASLGYDLALVSLNGLGAWSEEALLDRTRRLAEVMPLFGFYLQPAVGGKVLSYDYWKSFADIPNVMAIKIAPFNRYQTLEVVRAVCDSARRDEIALYTGNDDNIVLDLVTPYIFEREGKIYEKYIVGGLLGHWAVWTKTVVEIFEELKTLRQNGTPLTPEWLSKAIAITDANAAFFDAAHNFRGCIAGLHEVLRRQGLMEGIWCLDPEEGLSPGQMEEINRVYAAYPWLNDDGFVREWLG